LFFIVALSQPLILVYHLRTYFVNTLLVVCIAIHGNNWDYEP